MRTAPLAQRGSGATDAGLKPQQPQACIPNPDGKPDCCSDDADIEGTVDVEDAVDAVGAVDIAGGVVEG